MIEQIREHIDLLFRYAPRTKYVEELREELIADSLEKYADLIASGMSPGEAYREVIGGIGDISELINHFEKDKANSSGSPYTRKSNNAIYIWIGIALYVIAAVASAVYRFIGFQRLGSLTMFSSLAVGTAIIIYGIWLILPKYTEKHGKSNDAYYDMKSQKKLMGYASSVLWCMVVVLYVIISFISNAWHITWVIFLFGAAVQCLLSAWILPHTKSNSYTGAFWNIVVAIYIMISFAVNWWHISWVIFPLAVAVQQGMKFYFSWNREKG